MSDENENAGILASLTKIIGNNWRLIIVGVIILAIALNSSLSDNGSSLEKNNEPTPTPQTEQSGQSEQNAPEETAQSAENPENGAINAAQAQEPEITSTNTNSDANTIVQIAAKSEGITHLARKAIKEYLGNTGENLSTEQKIYAEDYLKRKIGSRLLKVGEKIEFDKDAIKQGIEKARGLNQKQIENLSKYVPLVKNLN